MTFVSTRGRYGLRLLAELAERYGKGPVDLGTIAECQAIPEKYLAKLVIPLKSAGLVVASRGARGGYELARDPGTISLLSVVTALEGGMSQIPCSGDPDSCERNGHCPTRPVWLGLERVVADYLEGISVADVIVPREPDYVI